MTKGTLIATALERGLRKRCPHCGVGAQFRGWADPIERCSNCGLVFEPNQGDTWFFVIIGDRLPVALTIVVVYFNLGAVSRVLGIISFVLVLVVLIWTTPSRWGVANALHYLSRVFWPDASDPIPK
jgi:uncharacterized protein (DUF983 family)